VDGLLQRLSAALTRHELIRSGSRVLVCVSGGSDSVALLHLLQHLSRCHQFQLEVVHFNHQLRQESAADAEFVQNLCESLKLPCHLQISESLQHETSGLQAKAREWRQAVSMKLATQLGAERIATAHQADDQIETWLLKWLRGAHLSKLHGMRWSTLPFIRPLLACTRQELQDFLTRNNLAWREDKSNQSPKYLRNRVRNELIPLLKELSRNGLPQRLEDLETQSTHLQTWFADCVRAWQAETGVRASGISLAVPTLDGLPELVQQEIVHHFLTERSGTTLPYRRLLEFLKLLRSNPGVWEFSLEKGWRVRHRSGILKLVRSSETPNSPA